MQIQEFVQPIMFHTTLNPKLWQGDALLPQVHVKLLQHAQEFIKSLDLDKLPLVDIIITGSNTAMTYTPQSDLDLHIIVNMSEIYGGGPMVEKFLDSKKRLWNTTYDVELYGIPVEIYVEDDDDTVRGNKYSLVTNQWRQRVPITKTQYDDRSVRAKSQYIQRQIERSLDRADDTDDLKRIMTRLKVYRQSGLDLHGEFSTENLVFKSIRNAGLLDRIRERQIELTTQKLSLD